MNRPRLPLLIGAVLALPVAVLVSAAGPAAAEQVSPNFGSHVSMCAQMSGGFDGQHNPSHHRGPRGTHDMTDTHC